MDVNQTVCFTTFLLYQTHGMKSHAVSILPE